MSFFFSFFIEKFRCRTTTDTQTHARKRTLAITPGGPLSISLSRIYTRDQYSGRWRNIKYDKLLSADNEWERNSSRPRFEGFDENYHIPKI